MIIIRIKNISAGAGEDVDGLGHGLGQVTGEARYVLEWTGWRWACFAEEGVQVIGCELLASVRSGRWAPAGTLERVLWAECESIIPTSVFVRDGNFLNF